MAIKRPIVVQKRKRKTAPTQLNPAEPAAAPQQTGAFNPRLFLTKLATGKTSREYQTSGSVFSQGDLADAVFYVESGKVKLTVVSTRGKEAVIAILPEGSYFGEGCLAGQPLRMATATAMQRSMITRFEKETMVKMLHQEPKFAELFVGYLLPATFASKKTWWTSYSIRAKNVSPAFSCCWPTSAMNPSRYRWSRR